MEIKPSSSASGAAGEYLVLGELLRRGYEAYLASGTTQEAWDLLIIVKDINFRVQIKTIDWPNENAVNGKFDSGFHFLVVVLLNRDRLEDEDESKNIKYVILGIEEVQDYLSAPNTDPNTRRGRSGGATRTLNLGKNFETDKPSIPVDKKAWQNLKRMIEEKISEFASQKTQSAELPIQDKGKK